MGFKQCSRCGESKPLSAFHKRGNARDGRKFSCKTCDHNAMREYRRRLARLRPKKDPDLLNRESVVARLEGRTERVPIAGCWIWTGVVIKQGGYGRIWYAGKSRSLHRLSYEMHVGAISPGMVICHACDVPACWNPAHLFVGTQKENIRDMIGKGRHWTTEYWKKQKAVRWVRPAFKFSLADMITVT
jgi:hypothetical protein